MGFGELLWWQICDWSLALWWLLFCHCYDEICKLCIFLASVLLDLVFMSFCGGGMFVAVALHFSGFCFAIVVDFGELLWWHVCGCSFALW